MQVSLSRAVSALYGLGLSALATNALNAQPALPDLKLPENVRVEIQTPAADTPADFVAFAGKWSGLWGGKLPSNLIVEKVGRTGDAEGVYAWGDDEHGRFRGGASRFQGKIENSILSWGDGTKFRFTMLPDGSLQGERLVTGGRADKVAMVRMPLATVQNPGTSVPLRQEEEEKPVSAEWLSKRCVELFNNKKYRAVFDDEFSYRIRTYTFTTTGAITVRSPPYNSYCRIDYSYWGAVKRETGWMRFTGSTVFTSFAYSPDAFWRLYLQPDGTFFSQMGYPARGYIRISETIFKPVTD